MAAQRCAQVLNGVVANVIEADPTLFVPTDGSTLVPSATAQAGWTYAGGVFTPVSPPVVYQTVGLSWLQFLMLFTSPEQSAILTSADAQTQIFRQEAAGVGGMSAINLSDPSVIAGVNYLASINLIAAARVAQILAGNPQSAML